jgi:O-acetyl-ADP-ribose deacetylase (regulator of RNase III)/uncharacterized protein YwgA
MFKALIGDLFESRAKALVNTVNCVGVMGKGIAQEFKKRFPAMFEDYRERCARKQVRLGEPYAYRDASGLVIVNFPTKDHWRSSSRLADIERGLDHFNAQAASWGLTSVAFPPLGCGNGGLEWAEVGPLLYRKLHASPLDVEIYAPYGTPRAQLAVDFLSAPAQMNLNGEGRKVDRLKPEWLVPLEVLRELAEQPYATPVGRTIFQKICYIVTEMGVPTGFQFRKGSYGPFSDDVKRALHELANRNWLHEIQLGPMTAMRISPQYEHDRSRWCGEVAHYEAKIAKTVDLFSRIKSTEQAEEVVTVLFASRDLKRRRQTGELAEQDLYDYVLEWKKSWRTDAKRHAVASAIRNLVLLGWMRLQPSESLAEVVGG